MVLLRWHADPVVVLGLCALVFAYLSGVRRVRARGGTVDQGRLRWFWGSVAVFVVALCSPVATVSEERFSVHMVQHLLLSLVGPPLVLMGIPGWLFRAVIRPRPVFAVLRALARPIPALLLFNGYIAFSHWPPVVQLQVSSEPAHFLLHSVLVGTALLMWMPVLSPVAEIPRLRYPGQMLYLFAQSIVPTVPASFLTFADAPLYPFYATAAPLAGVDAVLDQRIAGLIMKLLGGLILWTAIAVLFFKWHAEEEATGSDAPVWEDVERELHQMEAQR